jgi:Ca-activated chloride channel family protein
MTALPMTLMTDEEVSRFGRDRDAGFGALRTERGLLPLVAMEVDARVAGVIAAIELAQSFVNTTGVAIEATYIFPLPDRAAVHKFQMEVGGRVIDGVVEERGAAREQYDEAIARGHRAAITEEERAGVFTLRVGNLMPGDVATVRLSLVGPLAIDDGEVTFRFPLVVAPRYMPGAALGGDQAGLGAALDTNLVPDASRISPPVLLPGCPNPVRLGIRVVLEDRDLREISSSLHAVTTQKSDGLIVAIQPGERLDRDFILRWHVDHGVLRSSLICADDLGQGGTFMLTLVPPSTVAMASKPRDVVFVIDRSGSMDGWKMVAARRAAARMIDSLTSRDRFCAIAFDNVTDLMPEANLVHATDRHRYRAVEQLGKVEARGGTELEAPLALAAKMLAGGYLDRERVIVLVTDGQVGNEDHILRSLAPSLRDIKMFTLGIDQAVNAAFLKRLAGAGGGLCELVESEDRLDEVMAKVHRRIGTPIATELTIRGNGLEIDRASIAPNKLPDVYAGAPVTIMGRYRGHAGAVASIEIVGTSLGDPLRETVIRAADSSPAPWLAACWARAAIRDREDLYAAGLRGGLEHEIVALSKQYSVLSRFTAFLAIDRSQLVNRGGFVHQVVQAVEEPEGWGRGVGGQTVGTLGPPASARRPGGAMPAMPMASRARPGGQMPPRPAPSSVPVMGPPQGGYGGGGMGGAPKGQPPAMPPLAAPSRSAAYPSPPADAGADFDDLQEEKQARRRESERAPAPMSPSAKVATRGILDGAAPVDRAAASPYLTTLGSLARELEAQARGRVDTSAIRLLRQRLTEWVEDLRSVGTANDLAAAVETLVQRLSAALALSSDLATEALAIATELAQLAGGAAPPKAGRAFWK